jgi:hypothetical protein
MREIFTHYAWNSRAEPPRRKTCVFATGWKEEGGKQNSRSQNLKAEIWNMFSPAKKFSCQHAGNRLILTP